MLSDLCNTWCRLSAKPCDALFPWLVPPELSKTLLQPRPKLFFLKIRAAFCNNSVEFNSFGKSVNKNVLLVM